MSDITTSPSTAVIDVEEMKKRFWDHIEALRAERKKTWEAHKERIRKHKSRFGCDDGCADCAEIAGQIRELIKVGKLIGLVAEDINYLDFLA
jgi:hypothetical protein